MAGQLETIRYFPHNNLGQTVEYLWAVPNYPEDRVSLYDGFIGILKLMPRIQILPKSAFCALTICEAQQSIHR